MIFYKFLNPLRKALRFYAGFAVTVFLLQLVGLLMYFINIWPQVSETLPTGITLFVSLAVVLVLIRSCLWIRIYWSGAGFIHILSPDRESSNRADHLIPVLRTLTRLLVVSCILDLGYHGSS